MTKPEIKVEQSQVSKQLIKNYKRDREKGWHITKKVYTCYSTVWKRVQGAYKDAGLEAPKELNKSFAKASMDGRLYPKGNDDFTDLFSTNLGSKDWKNIPEEYRAKGTAGALASVGFATIVDDVWSEDLQPGAILQMWNTGFDYRSLRDDANYSDWDYSSLVKKGINIWNDAKSEKEINRGINAGHSATFTVYIKSYGIITGMKYVDQNGEYEVSRFNWFQAYNQITGANLLDKKDKSGED